DSGQSAGCVHHGHTLPIFYRSSIPQKFFVPAIAGSCQELSLCLDKRAITRTVVGLPINLKPL
ncbi:hypothetical protein, partial [Caldilinea sp.]|uniref:hypothetical protein n=1 Tax=Caldilinea sp. TaxID=2293560 RepID=UPI002BFAB360|nr:hypothetical protein [Caldilinea sp.]HRA67646.1 hypothetical protein [Caldilinea sp.]